MTKNKLLNLLKNTRCRIRPSKIEGVGIFAIKDIKKGENPFLGCPEQKWQKLKNEDLRGLDPETKKMINDFFIVDKKGNFVVPECGLNGMDISFFLNQSENPNTKTSDDGTSFVAARNIKTGEELTTSYADYDEKYKN